MRPCQPRARGFTLVELLVVLSILAISVGSVLVFAVPTLARERMRAATYEVETFLQLCRMEAISRNRDCRFVIDRGARRVQVWDGQGTASRVDDALIHELRLPESVAFASPDGSAALTLTALSGGTAFETVFASDGTVLAGAGSIGLHAASTFDRISVYVAGGVRLEKWNGSAWSSH